MSNKDIAIKTENLSKLYRLGALDDKQENVAQAMLSVIKNPIKNYKKYRSTYDFSDISDDEMDLSELNAFWALKDISFEIERGEAVGIIGHNGAGKSTLLKILSRITPPSRGSAEMHGRLNSLLEVGTGFHPELTGRENVYLNGSVLGMRRKEIDTKFDEIVDFSGVDKFLDTPVKRYSSGMRVRLAFAVAAHLEPEILIVDEVLAVGDAEFQRKCLTKMGEGSKSGQTVILVSHNMRAISRLADRVIWLDSGTLKRDGSTQAILTEYLSSVRSICTRMEWSGEDAPRGNVVRMDAVQVENKDGGSPDSFDIRHDIFVRLEYEVLESGYRVRPFFSIWNDEGVNFCVALDQDPAWENQKRPAGRYTSVARIPGNFLSEGVQSIHVAIWTIEPVRERQFSVEEALTFQVIDTMEGDSVRRDFSGDLPGMVRPEFEWNTIHHDASQKPGVKSA
ncbi:MAG: ABC transporter ATP-binding protein [Pseudomonadota bacterium]